MDGRLLLLTILLIMTMNSHINLITPRTCTVSALRFDGSTAGANIKHTQPSKTAVLNLSPNKKNDETSKISSSLQEFKKKYSHQPLFIQAVEEMASSLNPLFQHPTKGSYYKKAFLVLLEPERIISFRVPWVDDNGKLHINKGYRVEFSSALGPFKGGLRFHPSVDESVLKFLAFEQIFKNALTGLPLGGGKGGSDFDPKGKSNNEIMRFCESFMIELYRYLHPSTDVPAGDIGVGGGELGFLYGQYKRLTNRHGEGVLTGKPISINGSHFRPEATGYGLIYIAKLAIEDKKKATLNGSRCAISGSGNVAQYAADKLIEFGAKVITMSDSNGVLVFPNGMTKDDWKEIIKAKQIQRQRLSDIQDKVSGYYVKNKSPWTLPFDIKYDYAFPCATQNEIDENGASLLIKERSICGIFEGANLPIDLSGQSIIRANGNNVIYIPGKASNAGGVGVSGFEMTQNAQKLVWSPTDVDEKLQSLMVHIYQQLVDVSDNSNGNGDCNLELGANQAGFLRVVEAMKDLGWLEQE